MYTYTKHCLFDFSREMFISYNYSCFKPYQICDTAKRTSERHTSLAHVVY